MKPILLATINAKYIHPSLGLRSLAANLGELQPHCALLEFNLEQNPIDIAEALLLQEPTILGLGVYIWNRRLMEVLVTTLKKLCPELIIVLGGPEVSHEALSEPLISQADYLIRGEAEDTFRLLCGELLAGRRPLSKEFTPELPELKRLCLPYDYYSDRDLKERLTYVETSRGCPFSCEFCLSSLDEKVRTFDIDVFLSAMERLLKRGARRFKFVDRTFNLSALQWQRVLDFFIARLEPDLFLHFEVVPDRIPEELVQAVSRFPQGSLQFEMGVQTFNPAVAARISRTQDFHKTAANLSLLRSETKVLIHADLIVGLPGESLDSFATGFDRLLSYRPHEIQVGILKKLKGTPLQRHDLEFGMIYSSEAPYEILRTRDLSFDAVQDLKRYARYWDRFYNSGHFPLTLLALFEDASPFSRFMEFTKWVFARHGASYGLSVDNQARYLFTYLIEELDFEEQRAKDSLLKDYLAFPKRSLPGFLHS